MRICWTSSVSLQPDLKSSIDLSRSKWAGHRFEVVMVKGSSAEADGWKDITGEIVCEVRELLRQLRSGRRGWDKKGYLTLGIDDSGFELFPLHTS
jgi:hypothetical protein